MRKLTHSIILLFFVIVIISTTGCSPRRKTTSSEIIDTTEESTIDVSEATLIEQKDPKMIDAEESGLPSIVVTDANAKSGQEIEVKTYLVNNPGVLGMSFGVTYDDKTMSLFDVEEGDAVEDILTFTKPNNLKNGSYFLWDGEIIDSDQIKDGLLLKLKFKISESAKSGKYPIIITYDVDGVVNNNLEVVQMKYINGYIVIN